MTTPKNLPNRPERSARDYGRLTAQASIAAIPLVGGPLAVLFDGVIRPNYEKRLNVWFDELAQVVGDIDERLGGLDESALAENDQFVNAVIQASQIAMRTASKEKIHMLREALVQVATDQMDDEFLASRFLDLVDELTPEHFVLLRYSTDPGAWLHSQDLNEPSTPLAMICKAGLPFDSGLIDLLLFDLAARSLIVTKGLDVTAMGDELKRPFSSTLGEMLVMFVEHTEASSES